MKKNISLAISFLIIWALVTGGCYLIGCFSESDNLSDLSYDISIGFSGALGGTFGPILWDCFKRYLKTRRKNADFRR